ncbi:MAG TPA: hypothetical protein VN258_04800 [Mobilitalea sp.]|nr:hypothetical protein [Mobilitalea sp.]
MRKKNNKNYTMYWMAGISAILTIPISVIIISKTEAGNLIKTAMIMAVFLALFLAILLLYKNIFRVTVQEITQEEKVTELDRLYYLLEDYSKKYNNLQLRKSIAAAIEQIQRFKRRKNVMLQVAGDTLDSSDGGTLGELVQAVEDALAMNIGKLVNRIEIFDDQGIFEVIKQNLSDIEGLLNKNNQILMEFETLIAETSRMGEVQQDKDISKLRDVVNAMQSLRTDQQDEIGTLAKKYEKVRENNE